MWDPQQPKALAPAPEGGAPRLLVHYPASLQWVDLACQVRAAQPAPCKADWKPTAKHMHLLEPICHNFFFCEKRAKECIINNISLAPAAST